MAFSVGGGAKVITATGGTGVVTTNVWPLARIRCVGTASTVGGNECKVTDTAGNILFDSFATGAYFEDEVEMGKVDNVLGVKIATLSDTGMVVYFYLR